MSDSIGISISSKPQKPYPDFPLFPHASKRWAKKIKGVTQYFGKWEDPDGAIASYQAFLSPGVNTDTRLTPEPKAPAKPEKPYADFPLFAHATKRWAKKIKGRLHYFGPWANWQAALERYQYEVGYLQQGRTPPPQNVDALTVEDLVNGFLENRDAKVASKEMSQRSLDDYKRTGAVIVAVLGRYTSVESLSSDDFARLRKKFADKLGLVALGNEVTRCRVMFKHAAEENWIEHPVKMGGDFKRPKKTSLLREKQSKPAKIFTVEELQTLYQAAGKEMRAFMLLALNCGLGNSDIGQLEPRHIVNGWLKYPRPKTLVNRESPLWPITIKAIEESKQTKHPELPWVFCTKYGKCWAKETPDNPISKEFAKLMKECGLHSTGRSFYALRHQFRTVADSCRDIPAIDRIMGHTTKGMADSYVEWYEPERLQAVVDHVYKWLKPMFKKPAKAKAGAK